MNESKAMTGPFEMLYEKMNEVFFEGNLPPVVFVCIVGEPYLFALSFRWYRDEKGRKLREITVNRDLAEICHEKCIALSLLYVMVSMECGNILSLEDEDDGRGKAYGKRLEALGVTEYEPFLIGDRIKKNGTFDFLYREKVEGTFCLKMRNCASILEYWKNGDILDSRGLCIRKKYIMRFYGGECKGVKVLYRFLDVKGVEKALVEYIALDETVKKWFIEFVGAVRNEPEGERYARETIAVHFEDILLAFKFAFAEDVYKMEIIMLLGDIPFYEWCDHNYIIGDDFDVEILMKEVIRYIISY